MTPTLLTTREQLGAGFEPRIPGILLLLRDFANDPNRDTHHQVPRRQSGIAENHAVRSQHRLIDHTDSIVHDRMQAWHDASPVGGTSDHRPCSHIAALAVAHTAYRGCCRGHEGMLLCFWLLAFELVETHRQ